MVDAGLVVDDVFVLHQIVAGRVVAPAVAGHGRARTVEADVPVDRRALRRPAYCPNRKRNASCHAVDAARRATPHSPVGRRRRRLLLLRQAVGAAETRVADPTRHRLVEQAQRVVRVRFIHLETNKKNDTDTNN